MNKGQWHNERETLRAAAGGAFAPEFETVAPDPAGSLEYLDLYHQWSELYQRLQDG